jgi:hypothetical protein
MRVEFHNNLHWYPPAGRIGGWARLALILALGAFGFAARAQTVGPITPNSPAAPPQAPPESTSRTAAPAQSGKHSFAGVWKLNRDQSDDPRQKLEQASSGGGGWGQGPGGGWGGWGGGGWGVPGTGRGGWNRGGRPIPEDGVADMSDFSQLTIEQSDTSAKVTGATGRVLAQYSSDNGAEKAASKKSKDSAKEPPVAQWQGDRLVTTVNMPRGGRATRSFELSNDGNQLYVATRLESPRFDQPVNIRFVYDAAGSKNAN